MNTTKYKRVCLLALAAMLLALVLGGFVFNSPIEDLNIGAAIAVAALAFAVGMYCMGGYISPIAARHNLKKAGFCNREGQVPWLVAKSRDKENPKVMRLCFENQGIPREVWEEKKETLEAALNIFIVKVKDGKDRRHVVIHAVPANMGLPDIARWDPAYMNGLGDFVLVLGQGLTGLVTVNLAVTPHVLIGGSTGSGKSILLKSLLMQAIQKDASVYIADFKGCVDYPGVWKKECHLISDEIKLRDTLKELAGELETRKEILRDAECANIREYNEKIRPTFKRIIIACDEVAELLDKTGLSKEGKDKIDEIAGYLSTIARQGRAFGLHLILATQRPDATILPGQIKNNIDCRICGRADNVLSMIILDNADAADQISKDAQGRFLTNDGTLFQGFIFCDGE